jgi:glutamyl-tRNA synthetase
LRYYILEDVEYTEKAKAKFLNENTRGYLLELKEMLGDLSDFSDQEIEKVFMLLMEKYEIKLGKIAQPVRVAMTGATESPGIFDVIEIVGKEKTLRRLDRAIRSIGTS